ncbi:MAG: hypothetical protein KatS3mg110_4107 [Pirellulaceae bacterium]|nr:MAG: hypothetical protein KatS3mg110_4107 [Pirellulaceae bacterium]
MGQTTTRRYHASTFVDSVTQPTSATGTALSRPPGAQPAGASPGHGRSRPGPLATPRPAGHSLLPQPATTRQAREPLPTTHHHQAVATRGRIESPVRHSPRPPVPAGAASPGALPLAAASPGCSGPPPATSPGLPGRPPPPGQPLPPAASFTRVAGPPCPLPADGNRAGARNRAERASAHLNACDATT